MEMKFQDRGATHSAEPQNNVLDFFNQIPIKLRVFLEQFDLKNHQEIYNFLQPKISNLENPYKISNCERACDRLWEAWFSQENILVYGDYDLDGTSGIALIYESLKGLGFKNLFYFQPSKANDGYGLHGAILEKFKNEYGIDLVVTVDVGITGNEACQRANEIGLDVIITDHHLAQDQLPKAYAVVNPNQPGDSSGLGYLCGCGVGFYLIRGLCKKFIEKGTQINFDLKSVLPYFAIATVTDMVPLIKDNRTLLKFAFDSFRSVENPGLKALMEQLKLTGKKLDGSDIGLTLAPKINAISRMSATLKPIDLLFQKTEDQGRAFVKEILKLNDERKRLQEEGLQEVIEAFQQEQIENTIELTNPYRVFFYSSARIHHGVTGLIASKMVDLFGGSFFIGSLNKSTGVVVGSSRKSDKTSFSLVDVMTASKPLWNRFGGHAGAAGFEYFRSNQQEIAKNSQNYLDTLVTPNGSIPMEIEKIGRSAQLKPIDLDWFDLNTHFYSWVQFLEPFGAQFPEPIFRLKNVPVLSIKKMKEKHFKLNVVNPQNCESLNFVLFNSSEEQRQLLTGLNREYVVSFKIKKDNFNYNQKFQFIVEEIAAVQV